MPAKGRGRGVAKAAVAKPAAKAAVGRAGAAAVKREAPESVKASVKAEAPQQAGRGTKRDREEQSLPSLRQGEVDGAVCAVCGETLGEEVEGGVRPAGKDATGVEVTDGCQNCVATLKDAWPGWAWSQCKQSCLCCLWIPVES